jgi:pimeloyl-ACP methyl ester carboxylesterase
LRPTSGCSRPGQGSASECRIAVSIILLKWYLLRDDGQAAEPPAVGRPTWQKYIGVSRYLHMNTEIVRSRDGTYIAYDVTGQGPAIILLHGGGQSRRNWHEIGYVERLAIEFKVIAIDIRGNGESDKPIDTALYTTDKLCEDLLAVANACGVNKFVIWGYSYGGNIGRYLAARSDQISKIIIIGIPFGLGAFGEFRQYIEEYCNHWIPKIEALNNGTINLESLSENDRNLLQCTNVPVNLASLGAILDWGFIGPKDIRCPALYLVGSKNDSAMASIKEYKESIINTNIQIRIIKGLNHYQEFTEIDKVFPDMLAFTK